MNDETKDDSESSDDVMGKLMGYDKWPQSVAVAFEQARGAAHVKYVRDKTLAFASVVAEFRAIEAEFVAHFRDDEENAQQVQRIITDMLLEAAWDKDQPFETCQSYWNDLQPLGFYRIERQCDATWLFGEICREHGQTDIGLAVLDPLITELERLRAEPNVSDWTAEYYEERLVAMRKLRARLEADRG